MKIALDYKYNPEELVTWGYRLGWEVKIATRIKTVTNYFPIAIKLKYMDGHVHEVTRSHFKHEGDFTFRLLSIILNW